jgi:hypothetical protein
MNTLSKALALSLLMAALAFAADTKPDFSGSWELNVQQSDLGGTPITKLAVQLDHKDPMLKYTVKATVNGQDFEESESFTTDGKASQDSRGAKMIAHWDGATLVIEVIGADDRLLYRARMGLSDDGKKMVREYESESAGDAQRRREVYERR